MPAAAVIPAPRVYTKAVAVKKLVVNFKTAEIKIIYYFYLTLKKQICFFLFRLPLKVFKYTTIFAF